MGNVRRPRNTNLSEGTRAERRRLQPERQYAQVTFTKGTKRGPRDIPLSSSTAATSAKAIGTGASMLGTSS